MPLVFVKRFNPTILEGEVAKTFPPGRITKYFVSLTPEERHQATHLGSPKQWLTAEQIKEREKALNGAVVRLDLNHTVLEIKTCK